MIYAEAVYFDGYPFAHIAAYEERRRLQIAEARARGLLRLAARDQRRVGPSW